MGAAGAPAASLIERCSNRTALVGVIGFDIDRAEADAIASGRSYFLHIPHAAVASALERGFDATADFSRAASADALIICVPTPLTPSREPDLSFVVNTIAHSGAACRAGN